MTTSDFAPPRSFPWPLLGICVLLMAEFTAIGTVFKHNIDFHCLDHWPAALCSGASKMLVGGYCLLAVGILLRMLRPDPIRQLMQNAGARLWPLAINLTGWLICFAPLPLLHGAQGTDGIALAFTAWSVGMALMLAGAALYAAPLPRWISFAKSEWASVLPAFCMAFAAPWLAVMLRPLWTIDWITDATFQAVTQVMAFLGYDLQAEPEFRVIGAGDFFVSVDQACSGIEGIALVAVFVSLYLWIFRAELRFPLALVLYPIGIVASVFFNVVRVSALLAIGIGGQPDLAVDGFHSHAGWLMFTIVALGLIALAQGVPGLRKAAVTTSPSAQSDLPPFWRDPAVAQILPFVVFMFSALIASTLSQTPSAVYPLRVVAMIFVLLAVRQYYVQLSWRVDPVAVGVGLFVAAYWILIPVAPSEDAAPYGALTGTLLVLWFIARGIGTSILIPIIEEVFFRGYLESRLRLGTGPLWAVVAACVSAGLFAALHGRWAEAFVAGLLFSYVASRRGNITDAIVAHAVANAIIFGTAVAQGDLSMI